MRYFFVTVSLFLSVISHVSTQGTTLNHYSSCDVNSTFYGIKISPGAPLSRFESTLIIPAESPDTGSPYGAIRAVWPGMQGPGPTLLQQVLGNQGGPDVSNFSFVPGWYLFPYYYGKYVHLLKSQVRPGDRTQIIYQWNHMTSNWFINWIVEPAAASSKAGMMPWGDGLMFDQSFDKTWVANGSPHFQTAELYIEIQQRATWDWGAVEWMNILVEAETTKTAWCTGIASFSKSEVDNAGSPNGDKFFNGTRSEPIATTIGNLMTCYIANLMYLGP
ncbi:hypothetical protein N431DRAFT_445415 [Stipitochalara longipes BDJ]|nr:hypothetical protein N431DRAFT_445415 [Stipitochalara longipes BDJ]